MKISFMKATILCLTAGLVLSGCKKDEPAGVSVTGVSLNETSKTLAPGETFVLTAKVVLDNATNKTLVWSSSNTEIVAVDAGTVSAIAVGEATITVSTEYGGKIAACVVKVVEIPEITMTTKSGKVRIYLGGSGTVTVDWGDGNSEDVTLGGEWLTVNHTYAASSGSHTITITGATVTGLSCAENQLSALDVSKNIALTDLSCSYNQLSALDVSKNTALRELYCYGNQLSALDVSKNTALTGLECWNNQLSALDVSKNTALKWLSCYNNQLSALDVSTNTVLTDLYCFDNQLSAVDVSKNIALTNLVCDNNQLSALDVSKNTALTNLVCDNNQLSALDVSKNTALTDLWCYNNQLSALDVSKNTALTELDCDNNQLTVDALNALFGTLYGNTILIKLKSISISGNPGEAGCDKTIAERKGWIFQ